MTLTISASSAEPCVPMRSYRPGQAIPCPACGERQWLVGRIMAECACCETALPIDLGYRGWSVIGSLPPKRRQLFPTA
ncbi:hypothetical protein [Sphingobium sp. CCH11-B1]|jgi:hypothetical protein|uniref:hypothetical protein n=1 Tax=Sphingobium sp. CCH11-B1 TaxID=1768781 RepID=UPI00082CC300|nr:hypothetical protein [Sphingobium sp. CCH11-B1]MEA3388966.1 hypothetical protein [Pseudomonadota bacterium]